MDFAHLPDNILLQVFQYLPFDHKVRSGSVCSRFHQISDLAVAETRSLDLNEAIFKRIRPSGLSALLQRCHAHLERITFARSFDRSPIEAFAEFSCPRLTEIRIDHTRIGNDLFGILLKNNRNLQAVTWNHNSASPIFPEGLICEKLETIKISCFDDTSFRSVSGCCPNLKYFETEIQTAVSREILDGFFAQHPTIQSIVFREMTGNFSFDQLSRFWQLSSLRILIVCGDPSHRFSDAELIKISNSFPLLEELGLVWLYVTKEAVAALTNLQHLRKLAFENTYNTGDGDVDEGIARIAERGNLQELQFYYSISPATFRTLITTCRNFKRLCIWKVKGVTTPEMAAEIVQALGGAPSTISADIRICHEVSALVWQSPVVTTALENLKDGSGCELRFEGGEAIRFWDCL